MKRITCIFNTPSIYREAIYKKIDDEYDCDWYFEDTDPNLQVFNTNKLRNAHYLVTTQFKGFYTVKGLVSLLWKSNSKTYLMMGGTRNLSSTIFLVVKNIFFPRKKAFLWTHGWYGKESIIERILKRFLFSQADGIFLYGTYAKKIAVENGCNPRKLVVINNSLNYYEQLRIRKTIALSSIYADHFGNTNPVIVMIGRLNMRKKLDKLIEAISYLQKNGEIFNVVLIGDGQDRNNLEQIVREQRLTNQFWFYGACYDEAENARLIFNADICVVPGDIGLTAIHAQMFGCPVISHDYFPTQGPEFEAIKENTTGAFFNHDNIESLAKCLSNWFNNHKGKRDEIRKSCYKEIDTQWNPDFQMDIIRKTLS